MAVESEGKEEGVEEKEKDDERDAAIGLFSLDGISWDGIIIR